MTQCLLRVSCPSTRLVPCAVPYTEKALTIVSVRSLINTRARKHREVECNDMHHSFRVLLAIVFTSSADTTDLSDTCASLDDWSMTQTTQCHVAKLAQPIENKLKLAWKHHHQPEQNPTCLVYTYASLLYSLDLTDRPSSL